MSVTDVKQYYSLLDVTGIIDKKKRIYFVPLPESVQVGIPVNESFKNALLQTSSLIRNETELSRWSPSDRELLVEGNIDLFRKGSRQHIANYVLIKRIVDEVIYYDGFFITSAVQSGINSVRLSLEEDHFTNVFYWHHIENMDYEYNPFNLLIRNAYVDRQHYNRVDSEMHLSFEALTSGNLLGYGRYALSKGQTFSILSIIDNAWFKLYIIGNNKRQYIGRFNSFEYHYATVPRPRYDILFKDSVTQKSKRYDFGVYMLSTDGNYLVIEPENNFTIENYQVLERLFISHSHELANREFFAMLKEDYDYKLLAKTSKEPVVIFRNETGGCVIKTIPELAYECDTFTKINNYISAHLEDAKIVAHACVKYLHIITKERITIPTVAKITDTDLSTPDNVVYSQAYYSSDYDVGETIPSAQQHLVIPFISKVRGLEKWYEYFLEKGIEIVGKFGDSTFTDLTLSTMGDDDMSLLLSHLQEVYGYYIQSLFVTPYSELSTMLKIELSTGDVLYKLQMGGRLFAPIPKLKNGYVYRDGRNTPTKIKRWYADTPSLPLADYDMQVVKEPTIVFLGKYKPETRFKVVSDSSVPSGLTETFAKAIFKNLLYSYNDKQRKGINDSENFVTTPDVLFECDGSWNSSTGLIFVDDMAKSSAYEEVVCSPCFIVGKKGFTDYTFEIKDEVVITDIDRDYYEPVLNVEPYNYWSLSFLTTELTLQTKKMVFNDVINVVQDTANITYKIPLKYNQVVNASFMFGLIPSYKVAIEERFYSDALMYVSSNGLTVRNNSYYEFAYQNKAELKAQNYLANLRGNYGVLKSFLNNITPSQASPVGVAMSMSNLFKDVMTAELDRDYQIQQARQLINAQLAGAGAKADSYASTGTDLPFDLNNDEYIIYLNHYSIDDISYNSNAKMLERFGYKVDRYDDIHYNDRVGWNYVRLGEFDIVESDYSLNEEQESAIRDVFKNGVTLMHDIEVFIEESHNYEVGL